MSPDTTTRDYHETPYADEQYPIVGEPPAEERFIPMPIDIIKTGAPQTDVMFNDFGGGIQGTNDALWHLPQGVRYISEESKKSEVEQKEIERLALEEEIRIAREQSFEEGKAQGLAQAEEMIKQRTEEMNARIGTIIKDMASQIRERLTQVEKDAVKLSINITEKLIPKAVEINPEYIVSILQEALDLAGASIIKKVRVSPEDMEFINVVGLQNNLAEFDGSWDFAPDETIRAGCIVETSAGEVEYDLDKAWTRIKDGILKVVR